jgi:hypothetical protein
VRLVLTKSEIAEVRLEVLHAESVCISRMVLGARSLPWLSVQLPDLLAVWGPIRAKIRASLSISKNDASSLQIATEPRSSVSAWNRFGHELKEVTAIAGTACPGIVYLA